MVTYSIDGHFVRFDGYQVRVLDGGWGDVAHDVTAALGGAGYVETSPGECAPAIWARLGDPTLVGDDDPPDSLGVGGVTLDATDWSSPWPDSPHHGWALREAERRAEAVFPGLRRTDEWKYVRAPGFGAWMAPIAYPDVVLVDALTTMAPEPVASRCTGAGRRYGAAVTSALTRTAEGWRALAPGRWYRGPGERTARRYVVDLVAGTLATTDRDGGPEISVYTLTREDAEALAARLWEVEMWQHLHLRRSPFHGGGATTVYEYVGRTVPGDGRDVRPDRGCRLGPGECAECAAHRAAGATLVVVVQPPYGGWTWQVGIGLRRDRSHTPVCSGASSMEEAVAAAGIVLRQPPAGDGAAWADIVLGGLVDRALRDRTGVA